MHNNFSGWIQLISPELVARYIHKLCVGLTLINQLLSVSHFGLGMMRVRWPRAQ
jgi:hypothetical protein